ncbi:hypothetical protein [Streptomyces sp. SID10853]|uniref:hypothetical protein n=1 Tax=Streptomyces sp. SID10853 TaxID=2706028 RepID=UPI0031BB684D
MSSAAARGRVMARPAVVCALLFGLFLMHGAPASAAGGCHGVSAAASAAAVMPGGHGHSAMTPEAGADRPVTAHSGSAFRAGPESEMRGAVCVSTPARDHTLLEPAGLGGASGIALLAAGALSGRPLLPGRTGRRGPPRSGRSLLLQVCIARA